VDCRESLAEFVKAAWHIVEPGTPLIWNWHMDAICIHLEAVTRGDILRLLINVPPGHCKSLLVSVFWPAWEWANDPTIRSQFGSYDEGLVLRDSVKTRDLIESDWFRQTFRPHWRLKKDANAKGYFVNTEQGFRRTFRVGGKVTGHRGDKVVIDDPLNASDQYNKAIKDHIVWQWDNVLQTRVNDPRIGKFVVIMQRLAEDDLAGVLIDRGGYEHLNLPSEFEVENRSSTSIGWSDPRTEPGELLFPEFFTPDVLANLKASLLEDGYAGQHQQRPTRAGGGAFKDEWFRYWHWVDEKDWLIELNHRDGRVSTIRVSSCQLFSTVDVAVGLKKQNDFTVYAIWAVTPQKDLILLDRVKDRISEPDSVNVAKDLYESWRNAGAGFSYFGVEANGVGKPLAQNLTRAGLPVLPINVHADKMIMSTTARIRCSAGQVFFPRDIAWLAEWKANLTIFPNGHHDDEVTVMSLAAEQVYGSSPEMGDGTSVPIPRRGPYDPRNGAESAGATGTVPARPFDDPVNRRNGGRPGMGRFLGR
jgi:predicted phage terminase large subunit-like protein